MNYQNKFKKEIIHSIDYSDLDALLCNEYNIDRKNFTSALEQSNDSTVNLNIDGELDEYDREDFHEFLRTQNQGYGTVRLLLNDLCRNEKIEPGIYLINVCW